MPEGALFYGETSRRVEVRFDEDLRRLTESAAAAVRELFASGNTPPPNTRNENAALARSWISAGPKPSGVRRKPGASGMCGPRSKIPRRGGP